MLLNTIIGFLDSIGLAFQLESISHETFLPGLTLRNGILIIDTEKLMYLGDILHEAGHLACVPEHIRATMTDVLENNDINQGGELMAIAWSYAACIYLNIDPRVVFHEHGYKGAGKSIIENYQKGSILGIPMLQVCGMTYDEPTAQKLNKKSFPEMISWTCRNDILFITPTIS